MRGLLSGAGRMAGQMTVDRMGQKQGAGGKSFAPEAQPQRRGLMDRVGGFLNNERGGVSNLDRIGLAAAFMRDDPSFALSAQQGIARQQEGYQQRQQEAQAQQQQAVAAKDEADQRRQMLEGQARQLGMEPAQFMMLPEATRTELFNRQFAPEQPDRPNSYEEFALSQENPAYAAYLQANPRGNNVNVNLPGQPQIGSIPAGYEAVRDPETGNFRMQPIPGGPAERDIADSDRAAESRLRTARDYAQTVVDDLSIARGALDEISGLSASDNPIGGFVSARASEMPRTAEFTVRKFVESALNNVTLDFMNRMREGSPSGATGMGNMSDAQLSTFRGILGQWDPGLPVPEQKYLMDRIHNFYMDIIVGSRSEREAAVRDGRMSQQEADAYDEFYRPLVNPRSDQSGAGNAPAGGQGSGLTPEERRELEELERRYGRGQ